MKSSIGLVRSLALVGAGIAIGILLAYGWGAYTSSAQTSGGVSRLCADLTLAKEKLNYRPSIDLSDGLRLTLRRDPRFK